MTDEPQNAEHHAAAWGVTKQQVDADTGDLQSSLTDLAALVTGPRGLSELLGQMATYAANPIPGADGVGVTLLRVDRPDNRVEALAASDPFVTQIDEIQYVTVNEGPCMASTPRGGPRPSRPSGCRSPGASQHDPLAYNRSGQS